MATPARPRFPRTTKAQRAPGPEQGTLFDLPAIPNAPKPPKAPKVTSPAPSTIRPHDSDHALDPRFRKNFRRRIQPADDEGYRWWAPTSSSNPARPRTLQAAYNANERTMRVVFRDGTPWEYYGVEPITWQRFKRSASPGRFINRILNGYPYARGEFDPPEG